jgi:ribosomal protein L40E
MFSLISLSNDAFRRAAQLFITIVIILLLGKLITLVPVMQRVLIADTYTAADIIWFFAKVISLVVFFIFARYLIESIPNNGGALSFIRGVAEPLTMLLIVIMGQALLWQMLAPFVDDVGRIIYNSAAIILIVCVSIWFVLSAYRHSLYIVDAIRGVSDILSRYIPQQQIICEQCHAEISKNATFCSQCGNETQKTLCCSECGEEILGEQSYCQNCGFRLKEVKEVDD